MSKTAGEEQRRHAGSGSRCAQKHGARLAATGSFLLLVISVLAGCGGGGGGNSNQLAAFTSPPAPQQSAYAVVTPNYITEYNQGTGSPPFNADDQFSSSSYPVPISYEEDVAEPSGFDLVTATENSVTAWAAADPRVCVVSGVADASARIHVVLESTISYGSETNIIGLTTVEGNVPNFKVEIATEYSESGGNIQMSANDLEKTLTHELGHTLGLGHSPDMQDLMYYQANSMQGSTYQTYLTFGDAMTVWSTLNNRHVNWLTGQPVVSHPSQVVPPVIKARALPNTPPRGQVVCVYRKTSK
jgi:hypothetical protein